MRKRVTAVIATLTLLLSCIAPMTSLAQTLSIKKIVSVVFDDSSSMNDVTMKWSYANYAMQAFCGLLNKEDELYITYMSDYVNSKPFDMTKDIQSNVDSIRRHFQGDGTPIESVDTAINRLMSVPESNPNTQYWLVIITDGQFGIYGSGGQQTGTVNSTVLETKISDFVSSKMPNGSNPQVSYFAIGSDAAKLKEDTRNGIFSYSATGADEIVDVMSRIADKISGRIRIPADKMTIADDKTIQITSDLPMLNIAVLSQKTSARVSEVKGTDVTLTLEHSAKLFYPEAQQDLPTDESLKGGTFLFDNGNLNTPADTYTITFTEAVNKDSVVIMYEPAVEMRMKVYSPNGQEIADIKDLFAGDEIDVVCKIYESGTDKEIDPRLLSNGVTYYVSYLEGNELIKEETGSSLSIKGLKLKDIDSELKSAIEIPGFLPMTTSVSFHPAPPVQYTMTVTAPNGDRIRRTELYKNEKGMIFTIFGDGIPLTRKETENLNVHFTMQDPFGSKLELKTALNADGTYTCTPIYTKGWSFPTRGFWNWHVSWPGFGIPAGELRVMSGIGNGTFKDLITGVLLIEREHWRITLINILLPILITLFILGLIFRRRFRRGKKVKSIDVTDDGYSLVSSGPNWSSKKLRSFNIWSLIPWIPSRIKIKGVTFYAKPGGYIGVKIKNIGTKSSKLDGSMIEENKVVNYPSSQINDSFIPGDPKDLRLTKFEEFSTGDVLFNTQNAQNGRLFKFLGGN